MVFGGSAGTSPGVGGVIGMEGVYPIDGGKGKGITIRTGGGAGTMVEGHFFCYANVCKEIVFVGFSNRGKII